MTIDIAELRRKWPPSNFLWWEVLDRLEQLEAQTAADNELLCAKAEKAGRLELKLKWYEEALREIAEYTGPHYQTIRQIAREALAQGEKQ